MMTIPIEILLFDPAPSASAIGNAPSIVAMLVIIIGLNLETAASFTASIFSIPSSRF